MLGAPLNFIDMLYSVFPICGYMDLYLDLFQDIIQKRFMLGLDLFQNTNVILKSTIRLKVDILI